MAKILEQGTLPPWVWIGKCDECGVYVNAEKKRKEIDKTGLPIPAIGARHNGGETAQQNRSLILPRFFTRAFWSR